MNGGERGVSRGSQADFEERDLKGERFLHIGVQLTLQGVRELQIPERVFFRDPGSDGLGVVREGWILKQRGVGVEALQPNVAEEPMKNGDDIASLSPILGFDRRGQFLFVSFTEFRLEIIMPFEGGNRTEPFLDGRANLGEAGEQVTQNMIPIADPVVGIASSVTEVLDPGVSRGFGRDGVGLAERDPKAAGEDRREQSARIAT